jgi:hypothetical protein
MANGKSTDLIDATEVGKICGKKSYGWASWKLKTDHNFPLPSIGSKRGGGVKMVWRRAAIEAWWKAEQQKEAAEEKPVKEPAFAGEMAMQFIRGWFDPPHKQIDRRRSIERSRLKGIKNQPRIHLQGDWR